MQNSSSTNTMTGNNPLNPGNTPRQHQPNMLVQSPAKTNAMASMTGVIRPPPINRVPTPVLQQQQRNGPPTPLQQPQQQQQHFGSTIGRTGISQQQPQSYNNAGQQSPHNQPGGQSGPIPQGQPTFNMGNATNIPPSTSNANNNKANANALIAKPFPLNSNNNTANVPMVSGSSSAVVGAAAKPGQQQQNQNNIILNNQGGVRPPQPVGGNRIQLPPPSGQNQQPPQPQHQQQYQQQYQSNGGAAFAGSTGNAYKRPLSSADSVNSNQIDHRAKQL
ncbi:hypothetical protein BDR26DRAFT_73718 [Obelidium mucronatum]|nr:hypothetical protein BDR26DRAFT_73718 [Obelidium mucronatum]